MESSADFVAVDMPQANRLTIHILAAVAEHERGMISQRTKAALALAPLCNQPGEFVGDRKVLAFRQLFYLDTDC